MDDIARYNRSRWEALADAGALFTRPWTDLTLESARERIDPDNSLGDLTGKAVLCLAGGGGQQSVAFALLGAAVTVVDLSAAQLERDRQMAQQYGFDLALHAGDMRDLSMLPEETFDLVYQPYSLNFVPDAREVFREVRRVIKPGGIYRTMCANPFTAGMHERDWNGDGYPVRLPYQQGERITYPDAEWVYNSTTGQQIDPPVEYRQTLDHLIGGLVMQGFVLLGLQEVGAYAASIEAEPGTWDHFTAILPPWLILRAVFRPDMLT